GPESHAHAKPPWSGDLGQPASSPARSDATNAFTLAAPASAVAAASIRLTMAVPTTTPSGPSPAGPAAALAAAGPSMPKPITTGHPDRARSLPACSRAAAKSALPAPVTPVIDT